MHEFKTSLLREKFIIKNQNGSAGAITALSNRIVVDLTDSKGALAERFIVRAHNMHSCVRMSAQIIQAYKALGPLMSRANPFKWDKLWDKVANKFERDFNPEHWVTVYFEGKPAFHSGEEAHPFFGLIEQCDHNHDGEYEEAIPLAEATFKKAGKNMSIEYDGNVALVVNMNPQEAKCAVILRGPDKTTTFNFVVMPKSGMVINFVDCLNTAASFLEGMQLAFMVGMNEVKIRLGKVPRHSDEADKTAEGRKRLIRLSKDINDLEISNTIHYRPERPSFKQVMNEAETIATKIFS